jgi:predicted Rossmann fold nucleotide-binding protein DprA/Smf involved in DNA uptake
MSEKVGIVGERNYPCTAFVMQYVDALPADAVIVSGGGGNVDIAAERRAKQTGRKTIIHLPWEQSGANFTEKAVKRNRKIARDCDRLHVFLAPGSRGAVMTMLFTLDAGKPVSAVDADNHPLTAREVQDAIERYLKGHQWRPMAGKGEE